MSKAQMGRPPKQLSNEILSSKSMADTYRTCQKCKKKRPITSFYVNKDWTLQDGRDVWCKDCISKIKTKHGYREYFWMNERQWSETAWSKAVDLAKKHAGTSPAYRNAPQESKKQVLEALSCSYMPGTMKNYYKREPHADECGIVMQYEDALREGFAEEPEMTELDENSDSGRVYSSDFNGYYSQQDLDYLESYYTKLEEDFAFDDEGMRDYARKACKASLQSDKVHQAYLNGEASLSEVKDAAAIFDMFMKSANFAACRRKPGDKTGLTCWSETTMYLAENGYFKEDPPEFEKDVIDYLRDDYAHILKATGFDSK